MKTTSRYSLAASGACCGCALVLWISPGIVRADWESTPDIRMEIEANDNPRLGQQPDRRGFEPEDFEGHTATRMLLDARVRLRNIGRRGEVQIQPRIRADTYSDAIDDDLERQDFYLNSRASYRWPRTSAGMIFNVNRESIISAELSDLDVIDPVDPGEPIDDPIGDETGLLVLLDEFRNRTTFSPFAEFAISERSAILLEARYIDVSYTGPDIRGRTDFSNAALSLGVGRMIDDRTSASARMIVSRFEADETSNQTDTVGVEGSFDRRLNELWSFNLTTGLQRSDFAFVDEDGEPVDNAQTNYTMSIGFAKRTEVSSVDITLFRLLNPNAVGFLVKRNELRVRFSRQLSERLRAGFGLRAMETGALERSENDREFIRADVDVEWAFTPSWSFAARFAAVDQTFAGGQRLDGTANVLSVGAVYRGLDRPRR